MTVNKAADVYVMASLDVLDIMAMEDIVKVMDYTDVMGTMMITHITTTVLIIMESVANIMENTVIITADVVFMDTMVNSRPNGLLTWPIARMMLCVDLTMNVIHCALIKTTQIQPMKKSRQLWWMDQIADVSNAVIVGVWYVCHVRLIMIPVITKLMKMLAKLRHLWRKVIMKRHKKI